MPFLAPRDGAESAAASDADYMGPPPLGDGDGMGWPKLNVAHMPKVRN